MHHLEDRSSTTVCTWELKRTDFAPDYPAFGYIKNRQESESAHGRPHCPVKHNRQYVMPARNSEPGCRKKESVSFVMDVQDSCFFWAAHRSAAQHARKLCDRLILYSHPSALSPSARAGQRLFLSSTVRRMLNCGFRIRAARRWGTSIALACEQFSWHSCADLRTGFRKNKDLEIPTTSTICFTALPFCPYP